LCYAGGVALNSVANERILAERDFEDVFIMPASEDSGVSIGAAYKALWDLVGRKRWVPLVRDSVGHTYSRPEINAALTVQAAIQYKEVPNIVDEAARLLSAGRMIGWFQGGSELGPRALGQRSILCDPRNPDAKGVLNDRVKFREAFRPYAPVIPLEHVSEWFEIDAGGGASPFMLRVMRFRKDKQAQVPAVVHVDGTGRVQTVTAESNGRLHSLILRFHAITGVPILLNTSFNVAGEPIVETPEDALSCLLLTGLDACVIQDVIVTRDAAGRSVLDCIPVLTSISVAHERFLPMGSRTNGQSSGSFNIKMSIAEGPELNKYSRRIKSDHVRIMAASKWGPVTHYCGTEVLPVIDLIDGCRTGRQILEALHGRGLDITESQLSHLLVRLRRGSVLRFVKESLPIQQ